MIEYNSRKCDSDLNIFSVIGVLSTGYLMFLLVFKFYTMETRVDIVQG